MTTPSLKATIRLPLDSFVLDVDFETTHRVTGIFGVSGSGKTSLLEAIVGLRREATGSLQLGQKTWLDSEHGLWLPPEKRAIGYVPQDSLLFPHLTVHQNLRAGHKRALRMSRNVANTLAQVIHVLQLEHLLDRRVPSLSGGERQRVALGRALCSGPQLLALDEPLASLDAALRRQILPFLQRIRHSFDLPLLLVSHSPLEIQTLCDDVLVLHEGTLVARGAPQEVLSRPSIIAAAEMDGFVNVFPVQLVASDTETSIVSRIPTHPEHANLMVPRSQTPVGSTLFVSIPAHEILIARTQPEGLSARNVASGIVEAVKHTHPGSGHLVYARVAPNLPPLVAEVTKSAVDDLSIASGQRIFLIMKARSFILHEDA